jgi:signal transduction histidine kinase
MNWLFAVMAGIQPSQVVRSPGATISEYFVLTAVAAVATWSGYKLQPQVRVIVSFQLLALGSLSIWGLWNCFHYLGHPLELFLAVALGQLGGWIVCQIDRQLLKAEAQNFELKLRNRELVDAKLQMVKQDEIERRLLAADLHDQVLNDLKAIRNTLNEYFEKPDPSVAASIDKSIERTMMEIREVMDSLCPFSLEILGLPAALDECLRRGSEKAGFKGKVRDTLQPGDLDHLSIVELSMLYRLVQESITNICKHAGATAVKITIENRDGHLLIAVIDDGKGIDAEKLKSDSRGVAYMRQRADLIGASINWRRGADDRGTVVEISTNLAGRKSDNDTNS